VELPPDLAQIEVTIAQFSRRLFWICDCTTIQRDTLYNCNSLVVVRRRVETVPEVQRTIGLQYHRQLHLDIATLIDCHKNSFFCTFSTVSLQQHGRTFQRTQAAVRMAGIIANISSARWQVVHRRIAQSARLAVGSASHPSRRS